MAKKKKPADVTTGGRSPLFPDTDPLLGHSIHRDGDRVVVQFDKKTNVLAMNNEQCILHVALINAHRKALNVAAVRRSPAGGDADGGE